MKSEKRFYVYVHRRKTDDKIFYVGKGTGTRIHSNSSRNAHWHNVNNKHGRYSEVIKSGMTCSEACLLEKDIIAKIGIENLCNKSTGGESGFSGYKHTEEFKRKISEFMRIEAKKRYSDKSYVSPLKGVPTCDEVKLKISQSLKKRWENIDPIEKDIWNSKLRKGLNSPENIKRLLFANSKERNPSYDHTVYKFIHDKGDFFIGTQYEFYKKYDLPQGNVSSMCTGRRKSVKGWRRYHEVS